MALRFILGRAGTGKTSLCLAEVAGQLEREGEQGPPLILLVPEQATFQMERALLERLDRAATARGQVLSFHRLAQWINQAAGSGTGRLLGELGRQMVLRRILLHHGDGLQLFTASARQPGFVTGLARAVAELRAHRVGSTQLSEQRRLLLEAGDPHPLLDQKLHDLALVMDRYEEYLGEGVTDPDDLLHGAAARLPALEALQGAHLWLDGFSGFTPQEYEVLAALLQVARRVSVALCVDGRLPLRRTPEPSDLFGPTHETYHKLRAMARRYGIEMETDVVLDEDVPRRFLAAPALAHLENHLYRPRLAPYRGAWDPATIQVVAAVDPRNEVELAARHIVSLCRDHGLRYRDISVMVRDLAPYEDLISQTFRDYGIPFFIDRRRPLVHHPLMELVQAAVDVITKGWPYEAVFRYLKTDLSPLSRSRVDRLENYVLEHGLTGSAWTREEPWRYTRRFSLEEEDPDPMDEQDRDVLAAIDADRRQAAAPLVRFQAALARDSLTVGQGAAALYELLVELGVLDRLADWSREAMEAGDLVTADTHRQAWDRLVGLLDEMVEALGDETMPPRYFGDILSAGMEGLSLALIPPGLDQVLVGAIHRSRQPDLRATLLLGVNEGNFPMVSDEDTFFDDDERGVLAAGGLDLEPDSRRRLFRERYLAYIAVTRPRERLWVSYPRTDASGRTMAPSELPLWLGRLFPQLEVAEPRPGQEAPTDAVTSRHLAGMMVRALRRAGAGTPDARWAAAYRWLQARPEVFAGVEPVLSALQEPRPVPGLEPELVAELYGSVLRSSISRLQSFAACPFQHFANYGLKLEERQRHQVDALQLGILFHAVLRTFVERLQREGLDWAELSDEEAQKRAAAVTDEIMPRLQNEILLSTARYRHLARQVHRTVAWAVTVLGRHARRSKFAPAALELPFGLSSRNGTGEGLPPYPIPLGEGRRLELRGQIDRIDEARGWIRVVDYKRTGRRLSLQDVYYGLEMQLLAYLLVAQEASQRLWGEQKAAAGAFFFGLQEPTLRLDGPVPAEMADQMRLKEARFRGVMVRDANLVRMMDEDIAGTSDLIPARLNKDGTVGKNPLIVPPEHLQNLLFWTREHMADMGRRILAGRVQPQPYRKPDGATPCKWCDYSAVCRFEPGMGAYYRNLAPLTNDQVWERINAEMDDQGIDDQDMDDAREEAHHGGA